MIAEVVSTGDEVLLGDILDTNSRFLCEQFKHMGVLVRQITAVGDEVAEIGNTLEKIAGRADICLVTGGLGPTLDDVTALACAQASGQKLVLNSQALETMTAFFKKRGFEFTQDNKKQAMLPASAKVLSNLNGTAPGFFMFWDQCWFFFMPGVPSEMKSMFEDGVKPRLLDIFGLKAEIFIERLTLFGLPESRAGVLLKGFENKFPGMRLGFRAYFPFIEVKIIYTGEGNACDSLGKKMTDAREWVVLRLENKVVSLTGQSLEQEVGLLLKEKKYTLAIAESCTGGLVSNLVTDVPGSSDYFLFSAITYSNGAKETILKVNQKTLEAHGAVHEQTALEMARGVKIISNADWGISTTGIAGPSGGTADKPVGTVCIGIAGPGIETAKRYTFNFGTRAENKKMFTALALEVLRRHLMGHTPSLMV
ncbi:MAG: CinA family nicotinamide mononucleotide deamidase-related protein [Proteobacteria bacterium]|nr:CinA family nicotinamide mononucleotide deamidase-related protein [Desulfobacula sp.]MBU4131112.1 CinA family nicotinamide mononucleotide deamidase-related protein [Pseudomonadota bacterium]